MRVTRAGYAAMKGTRHLARPGIAITEHGVVGDRQLCLVDTERRRVLRTIENPGLVALTATYDDGVLTVALPDDTEIAGAVRPTGAELVADYWGRPARLGLLDGPHAARLGDHLGRPVALARAEPGDVVYGGPITIVGTDDLRKLAARAGVPEVDPAVLRPSLTFDGAVHDISSGATIRAGEVVLRVRRPVPRCAVIDIDQRTGRRTGELMRTLAGYRRWSGEVWFGLDAEVVAGGTVHVGDRVLVEG